MSRVGGEAAERLCDLTTAAGDENGTDGHGGPSNR